MHVSVPVVYKGWDSGIHKVSFCPADNVIVRSKNTALHGEQSLIFVFSHSKSRARVMGERRSIILLSFQLAERGSGKEKRPLAV